MGDKGDEGGRRCVVVGGIDEDEVGVDGEGGEGGIER